MSSGRAAPSPLGPFRPSYAAVVHSEDEQVAALDLDEMSSTADYVRCAARSRRVIGAQPYPTSRGSSPRTITVTSLRRGQVPPYPRARFLDSPERQCPSSPSSPRPV
jgi:hypothetical protein